MAAANAAAEKKLAYRTEIQQMMFVSGETGEPSIETIGMIEGIVQQQVKEMLKRGTEIANRAGSRSIGIEHLLFLIRSDKAKVARVRNFLSWKDVRKNVKDSDDKGPGDEFAGGADDLAGAGPGGNAAGGQDAATMARNMNKHKKAKVKLPWDVHSFYAHQIPDREDDENAADEEDEEMNAATLARLKNADERTRNMTKEEYVHFSDCRQASFTFRKGKRFREWAGFGIVTDSKPSDDVIDILGFLTFEIVQWLTEEGLRVKASEDASLRNNSRAAGGDENTNGASADAEGEEGQEENGRKRKREMRLFNPPEKERTPVQSKHIQEAYRRSQQPGPREKAFSFARTTAYRRSLRFI